MQLQYVTRLVYGGIRKHGLAKACRHAKEAWNDRHFDRLHGTDTGGLIDVGPLLIDSPTATQATGYGPTYSRSFHTVLQQLALPVEATFVDMGCGKGKAMMIAAAWGFQKLIGVELVPQLCRIARHNFRSFSAATETKCHFEVVECSATDFDFPHAELVLYMNHPFGCSVLGQVLTNLGRSLHELPRRMWLIYHNLPCREVVDATAVFTSCRQFDGLGLGYTAFATRMADSLSAHHGRTSQEVP